MLVRNPLFIDELSKVTIFGDEYEEWIKSTSVRGDFLQRLRYFCICQDEYYSSLLIGLTEIYHDNLSHEEVRPISYSAGASRSSNTGEKFISVIKNPESLSFRFQIQKGLFYYCRILPTLEQAITYRDAFMAFVKSKLTENFGSGMAPLSEQEQRDLNVAADVVASEKLGVQVKAARANRRAARKDKKVAPKKHLVPFSETTILSVVSAVLSKSLAGVGREDLLTLSPRYLAMKFVVPRANVVLEALVRDEKEKSGKTAHWNKSMVLSKATEMIGATLKSAVTNSEVELPLADLDNPYLHW